MKIEDQVLSIEIANELAGIVKLDTHFSYILTDGADLDDAIIVTNTECFSYEYIPCPAPTLSEIMRILPESLCTEHGRLSITHYKFDAQYMTVLTDLEGDSGDFEGNSSDDKPVDPAGEMLIWLLDEGYLNHNNFELEC